MKKLFVLMICAWSVLVAGCNNATEVKATQVHTQPSAEMTNEQKQFIADLCGDASNDKDIRIKTTFDDTNCYSA